MYARTLTRLIGLPLLVTTLASRVTDESLLGPGPKTLISAVPE